MKYVKFETEQKVLIKELKDGKVRYKDGVVLRVNEDESVKVIIDDTGEIETVIPEQLTLVRDTSHNILMAHTSQGFEKIEEKLDSIYYRKFSDIQKSIDEVSHRVRNIQENKPNLTWLVVVFIIITTLNTAFLIGSLKP